MNKQITVNRALRATRRDPPSAFRLPPSAFRLPPSAYCLLPTAYFPTIFHTFPSWCEQT
jgi:hypothetical protein